MKRLTERNKSGVPMAICCGDNCEYNYCCIEGNVGDCNGLEEIIKRLADIEDILGNDYNLEELLMQ